MRARIRVMHAIAITPQLYNPLLLNATMSIEAALADIAALKPEEEICYAKIARKHSVVQSTLSRQHQAITQSATTKNVNQQKLTLQQEAELVNYIEELTARQIPPTREIVRNFTSAVAQEPVSNS